MNDHTETLQFDEVKRRLRPADVFQGTEHDWKAQNSNRWKGTCPWHDSSSGTCFTVDPETLEWYCFHCERGGGPLQYVAELESIGTGAGGSLKGRDFFRAWRALSEHAGCEGPPDFDSDEDNTGAGRDRRPLRNPKPKRNRTRKPQEAESAVTASEGVSGTSRDILRDDSQGGEKPNEPTLDTPEPELRKVLSGYRKALKESEEAQAYVEGRGLSVDTLYAYGCGFAPPGEWVGPSNAPRLVTPHTTPGGRLVNLSGRYLGTCEPGKRHRHVGGNPTAPFNASATADGSGPLVICEGPLDALSFIEAGHGRAIATHGKHGPPWKALRGNVEAVAFGFDRDDDDAEEKAVEYALDARRRGYEAHVLHDEATYEGHGDPNEALQVGELTLDYLREIGAEDGGSEDRETAANRRSPEVDHPAPPTESDTGEVAPAYEPDDLILYWNGDSIGVLGAWVWERSPAPMGDAGAGLYADRELHQWIAEKLQAGPEGTSRQDRVRLRWVLWRLFVAFGPEDVPEEAVPVPPKQRA